MPGQPTLLSLCCYRLLNLILRNRQCCVNYICIGHIAVLLTLVLLDTPLLEQKARLQGIRESVFVFCDVWVLFQLVSVYVLSIDFLLEMHESVPMNWFLMVCEVLVPGPSPVPLDATCGRRRTARGKRER